MNGLKYNMYHKQKQTNKNITNKNCKCRRIFRPKAKINMSSRLRWKPEAYVRDLQKTLENIAEYKNVYSA